MYCPFDLFLLYTAYLTVTFPSPFVWQITFGVFLLRIRRRNEFVNMCLPCESIGIGILAESGLELCSQKYGSLFAVWLRCPSNAVTMFASVGVWSVGIYCRHSCTLWLSFKWSLFVLAVAAFMSCSALLHRRWILNNDTPDFDSIFCAYCTVQFDV